MTSKVLTCETQESLKEGKRLVQKRIYEEKNGQTLHKFMTHTSKLRKPHPDTESI